MNNTNPMIDYGELNMNITRNSFNVRDEFKNMTVEQIQEYQNSISLPYHVMCLNITGDLNTGVIIRTANAFGASTIWSLGRTKLDNRSLVGNQHYMDIRKVEALVEPLIVDVNEVIRILDENELVPIFVEHGGNQLGKFNLALEINNILVSGRKPVFIFGNEGLGIQEDILALQSKYEGSFTISIPQIGVTRSFNVASAASIVLFNMCNEMGWI